MPESSVKKVRGDRIKLNNLCRDVLANILTFFDSPRDWRNLSMTCKELHYDLTESPETIWGMINIIFVVRAEIFFDPTDHVTDGIFSRIKNAKFLECEISGAQVFSMITTKLDTSLERVTVDGIHAEVALGLLGTNTIKELELKTYEHGKSADKVISGLINQSSLHTLVLPRLMSADVKNPESFSYKLVQFISQSKSLRNVFLKGLVVSTALELISCQHLHWICASKYVVDLDYARNNDHVVKAIEARQVTDPTFRFEFPHGKKVKRWYHSPNYPKSLKAIAEYNSAGGRLGHIIRYDRRGNITMDCFYNEHGQLHGENCIVMERPLYRSRDDYIKICGKFVNSDPVGDMHVYAHTDDSDILEYIGPLDLRFMRHGEGNVYERGVFVGRQRFFHGERVQDLGPV